MLEKLKSVLRKNGYKLMSRPYELNIVGIRSKQTKANSFDDEIHVFYKVHPLRWHYHIYKATTDPGTFWLEHPMESQGTAILAQGQYVNAYKLGLHRGQYKALVQRKPVTIMRDYDRNAVLDFANGQKQRGVFGINIHHASSSGKTKYVNKYSAGCQVFSNISNFYEFMQLCEKHQSLYGNNFTYTLLDFRAIRREKLKRIGMAAVALGLGIASYLNFKSNKHK